MPPHPTNNIMTVNTNQITTWKQAVKTKPINAKHITAVVADTSTLAKLLVDTLEGKEPLGKDVMFCVGQTGDAWQQAPHKLLAKYTVAKISTDGWLFCEPKPDNRVNCTRVFEPFQIIGHWGAEVNGVKNVQTGEAGDYILQNPQDPTDVWIVKQKIFNNTYEILV